MWLNEVSLSLSLSLSLQDASLFYQRLSWPLWCWKNTSTAEVLSSCAIDLQWKQWNVHLLSIGVIVCSCWILATAAAQVQFLYAFAITVDHVCGLSVVCLVCLRAPTEAPTSLQCQPASCALTVSTNANHIFINWPYPPADTALVYSLSQCRNCLALWQEYLPNGLVALRSSAGAQKSEIQLQ